jgi:adenylate kinase
LVGPPGSSRKETALALGEYFNWSAISVGDMLNKELSKKSDFGKEIAESYKNLQYGKSYTPFMIITFLK